MPVPLRVGSMAPMFVLKFFLHSILFDGSALVSCEFLRSLFIVSLHVFLGLPRLRCPSTYNAVLLLIQSSYLATLPNKRNWLYRNNVCILLIASFSRRVSEVRTLNFHQNIARSLRSNNSRSLKLGAQYSLTSNKTGRIYALHVCPRVEYKTAREVNISKSSRNLPHADRTLVITLRSQPPPAPIVSPS